MKVIVLGGKGFVGSAVVRYALELGHDVTAISRNNYADHAGDKCDLLINANGNSRKYLATEDPGADFEMSVASVARSLHDFHADRYIYLSSIDVYSNTADPSQNSETSEIDTSLLSPYGFHKHLAEQLVRRYAGSLLILRMGGFVGEGLRKNSIYDMLKGDTLRVHPDSRYQYINTADLAKILFELTSKDIDRETVNIAGKGLISIRSAAEKVTGYSVPPAEDGLREELYEINIDKLESLCDVPETSKTVYDFIEEVQAGKCKLA